MEHNNLYSKHYKFGKFKECHAELKSDDSLFQINAPVNLETSLLQPKIYVKLGYGNRMFNMLYCAIFKDMFKGEHDAK